MKRIDRAVAKLLEFKLERAVGGSGAAAVDVILVELEDSDGARGLGFSYVLGGGDEVPFVAAERQLERFIRGKAPPHHELRGRTLPVASTVQVSVPT
jgi:L-alanine-DL-glutamate epimerase-like enolase superfamily enzyme